MTSRWNLLAITDHQLELVAKEDTMLNNNNISSINSTHHKIKVKSTTKQQTLDRVTKITNLLVTFLILNKVLAFPCSLIKAHRQEPNIRL